MSIDLLGIVGFVMTLLAAVFLAVVVLLLLVATVHDLVRNPPRDRGGHW